MRVLQVLAGLGFGGAERLVASLSAWLVSRGHEVMVANLTPERALAPLYDSYGLRVMQVNDRGVWTRIYPPQLVRLVRQFRPDVIHVHETAWIKAASASRWTGVPCLYTLHGWQEKWFRDYRFWLKRAARATCYCVGVASGMERLFVELLGFPSERTVYVRNGVPDIYLDNPPSVEWSCSIPAQAVTVGMVGRFDGFWKDQATLVRAFEVVHRQVGNAHLVFIGDGPNRASVEALANELGLIEWVHFLGVREDVPVLLHHLDVFVLSSKMEGESLAVLEAMSAQRPIVATAVGGTPGLLANGECGLLVPPEDPHAMAEAIVELLENREKAQMLAQRARQRFLEEYTIDRMGERYLEIYRRAIEERRRA